VEKDQYKTLEQIRESDESIRTKLYLTSFVSPDTFSRIKERFIDVFPFVEDLKIEPPDPSRIQPYVRDVPIIQIKEKGIDAWINEWKLSSGMTRTLLHISELYLRADGDVILIDEFENSLGVNCIEELTSDLSGGYGRNLQFIITSHHPYIINNIDYNHWKIVTRQAGVVTAYDARDFNLGKSKHQAFIQLINLDQYTDGVEV
jgi:predicted ATPase